jgi:hypothetical protein
MKRKDSFLLQNVGGQNLLVPLGSQVMDTNAIIMLNPTGSHVWELLATHSTTRELAEALADRFEVDLATAQADVQVFLDEITEMGLLER